MAHGISVSYTHLDVYKRQATTYVDIGRPPIHTQYTFEAWTNIDNSSANSLNKIFGRDKTTVPRDAFYFCVRNNGNIEAEIRDDVNSGWMEAGAGSYEFNKMCIRDRR